MFFRQGQARSIGRSKRCKKSSTKIRRFWRTFFNSHVAKQKYGKKERKTEKLERQTDLQKEKIINKKEPSICWDLKTKGSFLLSGKNLPNIQPAKSQTFMWAKLDI